MLHKTLAWLRAPANAVSFALRRRVRWQRGVPELRHEEKDDLFWFHEPAEAETCAQRERELCDRYGLQPLRDHSTRVDYRANLYVLDALEAGTDAIGPVLRSLGDRIRAIDVGSKSFAYAFALDRFLANHAASEPRGVDLDGVEVDGHGIYRDLYSRCDHAHAYAQQAGPGRVRYWVEDFLRWERGPYDVVTWLYPFLTPYPLLTWGLPLRYYQPEAMVEHALATVRPGGLLIALHQTSEERDRLQALLPEEHAAALKTFPVRSRLTRHWQDGEDRWLSVLVP